MTESVASVSRLVEMIARVLVDHPDDVHVHEFVWAGKYVIELTVHPQDIALVIGSNGRLANAIRSLIGSMGARQDKYYEFHVLES